MNQEIKNSRSRQSCARTNKIRALLIEFNAAGKSYSEMAKELNDRGFAQFDCSRWNKAAIKKYVEIIFQCGW
jgi:hypothetical protein